MISLRSARGFRLFLPAAIILPLLALIIGCSRGSDSNQPEAMVSVEVANAQVRTMTDIVTAEGVIFPIRQASISPKVAAPVQRFYVERGDPVRRGQLLAVLENHDLAAALVSAKGNYDEARATYASTTSSTLPEEIQTAKLNLENTTASLSAQEKLYNSELKLYERGAIARKQLEATRVTLTAAQSAHATAQKHLKNLEASGASLQQQAAKGKLEVAHGQYQAATAQLAYSEIRSPIDGVVASRAVFPGDVAPAGVPLLVVMNISKVIVRLHVPENEAAQLHIGDPATLHVPGIDTIFPSKITVISPALDPNSTTLEVWVQADNSARELKPGTAVRASISVRTIPDALAVPAQAILTNSNGATTVMVVDSEGRATSRRVKTGTRQGGWVQIVRGLKAGNPVIVEGAYGLSTGTKVQVQPARSADPMTPLGPE